MATRIDGGSSPPLGSRSFPMNSRIVETRCRPSMSSQLPFSLSNTKMGGKRDTEQSRFDQFRLLADVPAEKPLEFRINYDLAVVVHAVRSHRSTFGMRRF